MLYEVVVLENQLVQVVFVAGPLLSVQAVHISNCAKELFNIVEVDGQLQLKLAVVQLTKILGVVNHVWFSRPRLNWNLNNP